jgi:hypothetical protein
MADQEFRLVTNSSLLSVRQPCVTFEAGKIIYVKTFALLVFYAAYTGIAGLHP